MRAMLTVHHLETSRSQRVLWLLEELGVPYALKRYARDRKTKLAPPELKAGMDILKQVADNKCSPAEAEAQLKSIGMTKEDVAHNLGDFITKIYGMKP